MTATEELRELLDERGVEYETYIEQPTGFEHVKWNFNEHGSADFNLEFGEPWLTMYGVISDPEQAIAATLGESMTNTEKDALEQRIDELCQENEQLRQQNAKLDELLPENERWFSFDVVRSLNDERDQLVDENAQLRELVHGFAIYRHFDCQHCGYREQCKAGQTNCYKAYVDLIKRAKEFGIEVDA